MTAVNATTELAQRLQAVTQAGRKIAPTWPLDKLIAVNPLWEMRHQSFPQAAATLEALGRVRCLMPADYYFRLWQRSEINRQQLLQAAADCGELADVDSLLQALKQTPAEGHWHNVSDWLDRRRDQQHKMAWRDEISHQISQFCAAFCQLEEHHSDQQLYFSWLQHIRSDRGVAILMGEPGLTRAFEELPDDAEALLVVALSELGVSQPAQVEAYAHALLLDINGWASWLAYERWQSRLAGDERDALPQLVAIRLGWELALWRHWQQRHRQQASTLQQQWYQQLPQLGALLDRHMQTQRALWVWQRASEIARQQQEMALLAPAAAVSVSQQPIAQPRLQAVFCIDVRSEVIRRALEAQHNTIQTLGFAGFFGLPIEYAPVGTDLSRPQLPGLLAPQIRVTESGHQADQLGSIRQQRLQQASAWQAFSKGAVSSFSMVETAGLGYLGKLLQTTLGRSSSPHPVNDLEAAGRWTLMKNERPLTLAEKADLAEGVLKAMGLRRLAAEVLLVGHGSHTTNNPHAAGLDCGASGGQSGAINVQLLAQLLNDPAIREQLAGRGRVIPVECRFIAALHNTTTDQIHCYQPPSEAVRQWLSDATLIAQRERALALGLGAGQPESVAEPGLRDQPERLAAEMQRRTRDWSEVRPEWGLAGNSAFIVAPRSRTRGKNFAGRAFLHDYHWQQDDDFALLELIMTAPMVVTNWINMQYNTSVTEPLKYGSGNKVLHNVVGGNLGVFEGNGGDLRIGLPLQSLHDGQRWMHPPLRLSVYIDAPQSAIQGIIERHASVRQLVENQWLWLFRLDGDGVCEQYRHGQWQEVTYAG